MGKINAIPTLSKMSENNINTNKNAQDLNPINFWIGANFLKKDILNIITTLWLYSETLLQKKN
jgi:hypothetical protein|tara:strand:- start:219 stop:407 length:189 start_codon:yes stop_codon:yes gene_type:complete